MKKISNVLLIIIMTSISVYSGYRDTGFIKWKQPNGVEFTARYWGDDYFDYMETIDGYRIVKAEDGYFYYAILDKLGEFIHSNKKVNIDEALKESLKLDRSKERIDYLEKRKSFLQEQQQNYFNFIKNDAKLLAPSTKNIGVVLIKFPDVGSDGYRKEKFDEMFFSANTWIGTGVHPEGHLLFGSVYDYYKDQLGVELKGKNGLPLIVNFPSSNPVYPEWMEMNYNKSHYKNMGATNFFNALINEAKAEYGSSEIETYDVLVFVFTGENMAQNWRAQGYPASSLRQDKGIVLASERDGEFFRNIGSFCHELGHGIYGFHDEYLGSDDYRPGTYSLMSDGDSNGPLVNGRKTAACPAPISPGYKIELELSHAVLNRTATNKTIFSNMIYKLEVPNHTNEYFVIERYYHKDWYRYISTQAINNENGITIWHFDNTAGLDFEEIVYADNANSPSGNKFGIYGVSDIEFTDYTTPSSRLRSGALSDIAVTNIRYTPKDSPITEYGIINIKDPIPQVPTNFNLSGSLGQHPTLSWSFNGESDIAGYNIYRYVVGESSGFYLKATVNSSTTSWTDGQVVIVGKFQGPEVRYRITAKDQANQESSPTSYKSTWSAPWKTAEKDDHLDDQPTIYSLNNNFPNPFNPTTQISYQLPEATYVNLEVYNSIGQKVEVLVKDFQSMGYYNIEFKADQFPSGLYFYRLKAGQFTDIKKMILIK